MEDHLRNGLPRVEEIEERLSEAARKQGRVCRLRRRGDVNMRIHWAYLNLEFRTSRWARWLSRAALVFTPFRRLLAIGNCYSQVFVAELGNP